jgi:DNA-binding protein Fis
MAERPEATELKQILLDNHGNFTRVGKMFGVSDNAIRKWCKAYNLPYHTTDYKS